MLHMFLSQVICTHYQPDLELSTSQPSTALCKQEHPPIQGRAVLDLVFQLQHFQVKVKRHFQCKPRKKLICCKCRYCYMNTQKRVKTVKKVVYNSSLLDIAMTTYIFLQSKLTYFFKVNSLFFLWSKRHEEKA